MNHKRSGWNNSHFSEKHKKAKISLLFLSTILLTLLVPDGFLNMGQDFSFILRHRRQSLNYLSAPSTISGGTLWNDSSVALRSCRLDASRHKASGRVTSTKLKTPSSQKMVRKSVNRTPETAHKVNYNSFNYEFLIHGSFMFVKLSCRQKKSILINFEGEGSRENAYSMSRIIRK